MTTQAGDIFVYEGKSYEAGSLPLEALPKHRLPDFESSACATDCWRGYVGHWEIDAAQLWLTRIETFGPLEVNGGLRVLALRDMFPEADGRVLAAWYTGKVYLPQGKIIPDEDDGGGVLFLPPRHERYRVLHVADGTVIEVETLHNI